MIAALISFTANLRLRRKSHKQILGVLFPFFISLQHPHEKKHEDKIEYKLADVFIIAARLL